MGEDEGECARGGNGAGKGVEAGHVGWAVAGRGTRDAKLAEARTKIADAGAKKARAQVKEAKESAYQAEARAQRAEAEVKAEAEALAVASAWVWARGQARERGERMPAWVADLSKISYTLFSLDRSGVASDLWGRSPEARLEYSSIIHFIAPITRLPLELLHQIFLIIIDEASGPPVVCLAARLQILACHSH